MADKKDFEVKKEPGKEDFEVYHQLMGTGAEMLKQLEVVSQVVDAGARKLSAGWTTEPAKEDCAVRVIPGISESAEDAIFSEWGKAVADEIDTEIVNELIAEANRGNLPAEAHLYDSEGCYFISQEELAKMTIIQAPAPEAVTLFIENGTTVVTIKRTGEVVLGEGITPEFAAHEFWKRLAEFGGNFQKRLVQLEEENGELKVQLAVGARELELDLEDEQTISYELEETLNEVCEALRLQSGDEDQVVEAAKKLVEQLDAANKLIREYRGVKALDKPAQTKQEDPAKAYERAMKVVK